MSQLSLYRAAFHGDNSKVARLLKESDTHVDATNEIGETALHCGCSGDHPKTVLLLLDGGANPNARNIHNETPLHYASLNHLKKTIFNLTHYGADPNMKSAVGTSPKDLATMLEIRKLFEDMEVALLARYRGFMELFFVGKLDLGVDLCNAVTISETTRKEKDALAKRISNVYESRGLSFSFLSRLISEEVKNTVHEATLFRTDSIGTKIMTIYAKSYGDDYLKNTVGPIIIRTLKNPNGFELDTGRVSEKEAEENRVRLNALCQEFLDVILQSYDLCPKAIRSICFHLQKVVGEKFPESRSIAIGGFLFLRYFSAAISNPENYALLPEVPPMESRRPLVLVAKTIQNLANGVEFGVKEPYMIPMNDFLSKSAAPMRDFFEKFTDAESGHFVAEEGHAGASEVRSSDLVFLHSMLNRMLPKMLEFKQAGPALVEKWTQVCAKQSDSSRKTALQTPTRGTCGILKCECTGFIPHSILQQVCFKCEHNDGAHRVPTLSPRLFSRETFVPNTSDYLESLVHCLEEIGPVVSDEWAYY